VRPRIDMIKKRTPAANGIPTRDGTAERALFEAKTPAKATRKTPKTKNT